MLSLFAKSRAYGPASELFVRCSKTELLCTRTTCIVSCRQSYTFCLIKGEHRNKFCERVSSVDHCIFAPIVPSAHNVANAQLVGGRLQKFGQKWSLLGANPTVVSILKDGYILPFKIRPLVRNPLIFSGYANPLRNLYLREALQPLVQKEAVEMGRV